MHTAAEASEIPEVEAIPVESLTQLVNHLLGVAPIDPFPLFGPGRPDDLPTMVGCRPQFR